MKIDDLVLISVDDHVVEPAGLFDRHLPERWRDRAPRGVRAPNGADVWMWGDQRGANFGLNAVAGRPPEEDGMKPVSFRGERGGCHGDDAPRGGNDVDGGA